MIKKLMTGLLLTISTAVFSQVGIQTQTPHASADLDLGSENKALYLNRVADPENDIANPQVGMVLYDTALNCVRVYQGNPAKWSDCLAGTPVTTAPNNPVGTGSLTGRTCFDVVEVFVSNECGTISSRESQKANFLQTATNTQTYTFTPTGTVSNVRFVYVNKDGKQVIRSLTGGNSGNNISAPVTATAVYYNNLNTTARGLSRDAALVADIYVIYNDGASNNGTDRQLKLTARVQDCACCGAYIAPNVWKNFMCYNLGSTGEAQGVDPHAGDSRNHGAKYQWGINEPFSKVISGSSYLFGLSQAVDQSQSGAFVSNWNRANVPSGSQWLQNAKGTTDPCPAGFRVPTRTEWQGVIDNNTATYTGLASANSYSRVLHFGTAGGYTLSLPVAGMRPGATWGDRYGLGFYAFYWSTTYTGSHSGSSTSIYAHLLAGSNNPAYYDAPPTVAPGSTASGRNYDAMSVRCIQE